VTSLFDPLDPIGSMGRMWTRGQRDAQSWFDQWVDATAAWTSAASLSAPTPERLLGELIDGVLARFGGQRMTMTLHGHAVSGVLEGLRISGPAGDHRAHAVLTDVDWEGRRLEEVVVRARRVRLGPGLTSTLTAEPVEIEGRARLEEALTWAATAQLDWTVDLDAAGELRAVHRGDRPYRITGEALVRDGGLQVQVVAIGYGDVGLRLPRWVRLVRHLDLPPLPKGTTLVDAHRIGDEVSFRVRLDDVRYDLDLARVRDAIMRGATLPLS
jgi:hypothetical protein